MSKYRNQIIGGFIVGFIFYAVYLFVAESRTEGSLLADLRAFPLWLLLPLSLLQIVAAFLRWVEWHYYLGVIGAREKISVLDSVVLQFTGFIMVVSPGKAAELLKSVLLKLKTDTPIARSAPVVLAERVVDGIGVVILVVVAFVLGGDRLNIDPRFRTLIYVSAALLATGLVVIQIAPLAYFFLNLLKRIPLLRRAHEPLVTFYESSREVFQLRHVVPMSLVGVGVYLTAALSLILVLYGFGQAITWDLFLIAAVIAGIASAVGASSFVPNGAGATEVSISLLLVTLLGMAGGVASAAAVIQGFFNKWFRVFLGMGTAVVFRDRLFTDELEAELQQAQGSSAL